MLAAGRERPPTAPAGRPSARAAARPNAARASTALGDRRVRPESAGSYTATQAASAARNALAAYRAASAASAERWAPPRSPSAAGTAALRASFTAYRAAGGGGGGFGDVTRALGQGTLHVRVVRAAGLSSIFALSGMETVVKMKIMTLVGAATGGEDEEDAAYSVDGASDGGGGSSGDDDAAGGAPSSAAEAVAGRPQVPRAAGLRAVVRSVVIAKRLATAGPAGRRGGPESPRGVVGSGAPSPAGPGGADGSMRRTVGGGQAQHVPASARAVTTARAGYSPEWAQAFKLRCYNFGERTSLFLKVVTVGGVLVGRASVPVGAVCVSRFLAVAAGSDSGGGSPRSGFAAAAAASRGAAAAAAAAIGGGAGVQERRAQGDDDDEEMGEPAVVSLGDGCGELQIRWLYEPDEDQGATRGQELLIDAGISRRHALSTLPAAARRQLAHIAAEFAAKAAARGGGGDAAADGTIALQLGAVEPLFKHIERVAAAARERRVASGDDDVGDGDPESEETMDSNTPQGLRESEFVAILSRVFSAPPSAMLELFRCVGRCIS